MILIDQVGDEVPRAALPTEAGAADSFEESNRRSLQIVSLLTPAIRATSVVFRFPLRQASATRSARSVWAHRLRASRAWVLGSAPSTSRVTVDSEELGHPTSRSIHAKSRHHFGEVLDRLSELSKFFIPSYRWFAFSSHNNTIARSPDSFERIQRPVLCRWKRTQVLLGGGDAAMT